MLTSGYRGAILCVLVGLLIIITGGSAGAFPVTLPSGKVIDLTPEQLELLKQSPGIYYIEHRPERLINKEIQYWTVIELPRELGGGFIIANPQNLAQGLERLNAREIPDRGVAVTKSTPKGSDSEAEIKPVGKKDVPLRNDWRLTLDIGYRRDDLDWNIAGFAPAALGGNFVNILSELTWSDLEIMQLELGLTRTFPNRFVLKGEAAYGIILDGENQDSDYSIDNRRGEWSRSNNSADDGSTSDISIGLGYYFTLFTKNLIATPLLGFSYHGQNLIITEGVQTIATPLFTPDLGPFPGLNSSYDASWLGPWVGLDLEFRIYKREGRSPVHEFLLGIEYHEVEYNAEADWNLRANLAHPVSFEHRADGEGIVYWARWNYFFHPQWSFSLSGNYQDWETDPGTDQIFGALGGTAETPLNEVNWESYSVMLGVTCRF